MAELSEFVAVLVEVAVVAFPMKSPLKVVAVSSPIKGLKPKRLVLTLGCKAPLTAETNTGNTVPGLASSASTLIFAAFTAFNALLTCPVTLPTKFPTKPFAVKTPVEGI